MRTMLIYITAANRTEARRLAAALVGERLAACANLLPAIESRYWWKGRIEEGREVALLAKTRATLVPRLIRRVKALHSYETPCIVALPIAAGYAPFLRWIAAETRPAPAAQSSRRPPSRPARSRK